ncbi:MAG: hypothetical protein ACFFFH_02330 [Candidatus Thorarchaeota archaeon]
MATWIVHLRLTEALLNVIPRLDPPNFTIGNIAPYSISLTIPFFY